MSAAYLIRVGLGAAVAAAVCDVGVWLLATARGWSLIVGDQQVMVLSVVLVCLLVGLLAGLGSYVAARVTKKPAVWVAAVGVALLIASVRGLPPTLTAMHVITGGWIIGWLVAAVRGGSHVPTA